ncbi:unnamed protein product [Effrenium voratum]|nr:unnamed protein product [Effrenium voratum]
MPAFDGTLQASRCRSAKAERELRSGRSPQLCATLSHFMQLFDVKDVDGCIPAMNELFNRFGELNMLHKIVRDHLGLPSSGVVTVTDTVRAMEGGFGADWGNDF